MLELLRLSADHMVRRNVTNYHGKKKTMKTFKTFLLSLVSSFDTVLVSNVKTCISMYACLVACSMYDTIN